MGLLSRLAAQYDLAVEWFARAIRQEPKPQFLTSLGVTLRRLGRLEGALKALDKVVQLEPAGGEGWRLLGETLAELERFDEALLSFQHALMLNPRDVEAIEKSGTLLIQLGRLSDALACFDACVALQPDAAATRQLRALTLFGLNRFEE